MNKILEFLAGTNQPVQAQVDHFMIGCLFVFAFAAVFNCPILGIVLALVYAIPKEFVLDVKVENGTIREGFRDIGFLCLGIGVAVLSLVFSGRFSVK